MESGIGKIIKVKLYILAILALWSCNNNTKLPILGERDWTTKTVDGKEVVDTIYNVIPPFTFINQNGDTVTEKITEGKIYVADFFFTTCPTICPVMKRQMIKIYNEYKGNDDVMILSHSIDPEHDTPQVLAKYASDLGIQGKQWQFLTGEKEKIFKIGQTNYMVTVETDSGSAGGFLHSGAFILIDKEKHVRGMYDGTTDEGVERLSADMRRLLKEYEEK
jgi:protein SCO1/2